MNNVRTFPRDAACGRTLNHILSFFRKTSDASHCCFVNCAIRGTGTERVIFCGMSINVCDVQLYKIDRL